MPRRFCLLTLLLALFTATLAVISLKTAPPTLTVVSWAGSYAHAQMSTQITPFSRQSGAGIRLALYDGGTADIAHQVTSGTTNWDVVDMELPDAIAACRAGLLEHLATPSPSPTGRPAEDDFYRGATGPCWTGEIAYSRLIGIAPHRFTTPPAHLSDFFDTLRFPGKRLISGSAHYNMEMALLADGVRPADVYPILSTADGRKRALGKLDTLRKDLLFAAPSDNPAHLLSSGAVTFATLLNGDLYDAAGQGQLLQAIWDHQLVSYDVLVMVHGTPRKKLAADYIRYATTAPTLGALTSWLPYGPARKSAAARIANNPALQISMRPYQPTSDNRMQSAFIINEGWWKKHGAEAEADWLEWRKSRMQ